MKIKHTLCGLLLVATVLALQCGSIIAQGKNEHAVVSVQNLALPFFAFMKTQAEDEGKQLGIQVTVEDGQGKSPTQSSEVRTAVTQGVDGIVLIPNDVNALTPATNEVIAAKIPIVTVDRNVAATTEPIPHVTADNVSVCLSMV